jgi:hypothetical protein
MPNAEIRDPQAGAPIQNLKFENPKRRSLGLRWEFGLGLFREVVLAGDDLAARFGFQLAACAACDRPAFLRGALVRNEALGVFCR